MVPKEVAAALLIQQLDLTPEFSTTVPKVKVPNVNSTTKLTSLPLRKPGNCILDLLLKHQQTSQA